MQYTPYTIPLVLNALILLALAYATWRQRSRPAAIPMIILNLALFEWVLAYAGTLAFVDVSAKLVSNNLVFLGICLVPPCWFVFVVQYTGHSKWLNRRTYILLAIMPLLTQVVIWTNEWHQTFWTSRVLGDAGGFIFLYTTNGPTFWIHAVYSYAVLLVANALLIWGFIQSRAIFRAQVFTLLLATFIPWVANALSIFGVSPFKNLDLTPFAFTITNIMFFWSLYRYRLFDIAPIARDIVFERMSDAVLVLDAQNRIVDINRAALDIIGLSSSSMAVGKMAGEVLVKFSDLVEHFRNINEGRVEISLDKEGPLRFFQMRITPLTNRQAELTGRLFLLQEISEIKRATEQIESQNNALLNTNEQLSRARKQAEEANRLKSEFLATMSHELRTPLNSIIGYTDFLLMSSNNLSEKQTDYLNRVVANGERLLALINDVLDLSKIEAARVELLKKPFTLAELLEGVRSRTQSLADQKGIKFETSLDPSLPPRLEGDVQRLEQILTNLVGNAIRFTKEGGVKIIFARSGVERWRMEVSDTGIGIPAHALEYIFDEFRQVDGSPQREYGGTGLGLAIVRKLCHLMGGTIQVESEVGKGSKFTVQLPLIVAETPVIATLGA